MQKTLSVNDFIAEFEAYGREYNFTRESLVSLFEFFEEFEGFELDVIGICCQFTEYDYEDLPAAFDHVLDESEEYSNEEWLEALNELTIAIPVSADLLVISEF